MIEKIFKLKKFGTDIKTEIRAGVTTFLTMAYIVIVNPAILEGAGIPRGPSFVATIFTVVIGTLIMAFHANRPFAIAPLMGENAFVSFTVCKVMGYSWQTALAGIFISGSLITILTITKLRSWLINSIPLNLKYALAVGIGLFLAFIGFNESGIVKVGTSGVPVQLGKFNSPSVLLSIFGLMVTLILIVRKTHGAILIGILITTLVGFITRIVPLPKNIISLPPSIKPIFLKLDFSSVFSINFLPILLTMFLMDFLDMMGTLIGCSIKAGFVDEKGNLPEIEKPMLADSSASIFSAILGTTTAGTYIESVAGIQEGGKTGLTAFVVSILFFLCLFFSPFLTAVPPSAYGPALIVVGFLMVEPMTKIDFKDYTEFIPSFVVISLMSFTYNIAVGLIAGFVIYPLLKIFSGRGKEVSIGLWVLFILSLIFFVFYHY